MASYDRLPARVREIVREMPVDADASEIEDVLVLYEVPVAEVIAFLKERDAELRAEHRADYMDHTRD